MRLRSLARGPGMGLRARLGVGLRVRLGGGLRRDDGVSLVEVLVAVVILGIVIAPLANGLIVFLRNTDSVTQRLSESHDAQISAAYFTQDVQSLGTRDWSTYPPPLRQSVELNAPVAGGLHPCGPVGTPNALVRFSWDDPAAATGQPDVIVAAYVEQTVGAEHQLRRITCRGTTVTSNVVLVHNLVGAGPVECVPATCTSAAVPSVVRLPVTIRDPANTGAALTILLSGQRRQT